MVMILRPHSLAFSISSEVRIIVPSSRMISQHRPHCSSPARRHRSTVASVWPLRVSTPPRRATSGKTCPGRRSSSGLVWISAHLRQVKPRSSAEMPVVVSTWSIETVNAVWWLSVLTFTICSRPRRSATCSLIGVQIKPLAWVAMKLTFSVVANCAAQMRSPSFSRSGSSMVRMRCPARSSSSASSTVLN